jgi:hypothetical protein
MSVEEVVIAPRSPVAELYNLSDRSAAIAEDESLIEILGSQRFHPTLGNSKATPAGDNRPFVL